MSGVDGTNLNNVRTICKINATKEISATSAPTLSDIQLLNDLTQIFDLLDVANKMKKEITQQTLTNEANDIYMGASAGIKDPDPLKRAQQSIDAAINVIDGKSKRKRNALAEDRKALGQMKETVARALEKFEEIKQKLSPESEKKLHQILAVIQGPFGVLEVPKYLRTVIQTICLSLSEKTKSKLGMGRPGWLENLKRQTIYPLITDSCQDLKFNETLPPTSAPTSQPAKPAKPAYDFGFVGGGGYALANGKTSLLTGKATGPLGQGAINGQYLLNERLALQAYYTGQVIVANNFKQSNLGNDEAAAAIRYEGEKPSFQLRAGWQRYNTVAVDEPNTNGVIQDARFIYRFGPTFTLHVDESLFSGYVGSSWQSVAQVQPGVTVNLNQFHPFLGGTAGYSQTDNQPIYGGFAGLRADLTQHQELNFRFDYTKTFGIKAQARYFYSKPIWGVGPTATFDSLNGEHSINGGVAGYFAFGKLFRKPNSLELQGFVQGGFTTNTKDTASDVSFGIFLRWGSLRIPTPPALRPDSLIPLREGL